MGRQWSLGRLRREEGGSVRVAEGGAPDRRGPLASLRAVPRKRLGSTVDGASAPPVASLDDLRDLIWRNGASAESRELGGESLRRIDGLEGR